MNNSSNTLTFKQELETFKAKYGLGISNELDLEIDDSFVNSFIKPDFSFKEKDVKVSFEKVNLDIRLENILDKINEQTAENILITIPDNYKGRLHVKTKTEGNSSIRLKIVVGKNSNCGIHHEISGFGKLVTGFVEIVAKDDAKVDFVESVDLDKDSVYYSKKLSKTGINSNVLLVEADFSSKKIYSRIRNDLDSDHGSARACHLFFSKDMIVDVDLVSSHNARNTFSDILSKGVLKNSKSFVRGLVKINEDAFNSNGYQKSDALLLDDSRAVSIPDLEIHNNDVKCSHGSTVTRLDESKVFYMRSRGLSKERAELELIEGFFEPVLSFLSDSKVKTFLQKRIERAARMKE